MRDMLGEKPVVPMLDFSGFGQAKPKQPQAKLLLLGILPQGRRPTDSGRLMFTRVNALIAKLADGKMVFFRDHGPSLLEPDGQLSEAVSPDGTHLSRFGYERWAAVLEPDLKKIMEE